MVGKTNLELESILNNAVARLEGADKETNSRIAKLEKSINERFEKTEKKIEEGFNKVDYRFDKIMTAISALHPNNNKGKEKENEPVDFHSLEKDNTGMKISNTNPVISFKPSSMNMAAQDTSSSDQPLSKLFKSSTNMPSFSSKSTFAPKRKFPQASASQYHSDPPQSSPSFKDKEGAVNLYRPPTETSLILTQREKMIRQYFPDFFPRSEADNPCGPLREATNRNRVVFPQDWKLKFADPNTLEKVYKMQVAMIQSMLPYTAWPVRVALEMEEDFLAVRRNVHNHSLDWAGTVELESCCFPT